MSFEPLPRRRESAVRWVMSRKGDLDEVYVVRCAATGEGPRVLAVCERGHEARNEAAAWMLGVGGIDWDRREDIGNPLEEEWVLEGVGWVGIERWEVIPSGRGPD